MVAVAHAARMINGGDHDGDRRRRHGVDVQRAVSVARTRAPAIASATATLIDEMVNDGLLDYYFDEAMASQAR